MDNQYPISREEAVQGVAVALILSIVTCGIYSLVWQYKQFKVLNAWLGREEHNFWLYLGLAIITCGIYAIYYEYKFALSFQEVQRKIDRPVNEQLPLLAVLLGIFGLTLVTWSIQQVEINAWYGVDQSFL